jgi:hypothetical protein
MAEFTLDRLIFETSSVQQNLGKLIVVQIFKNILASSWNFNIYLPCPQHPTVLRQTNSGHNIIHA